MEQFMRIKGMVCRRCIDTVAEIFRSGGLQVVSVELGEVVYRRPETAACLARVKHRLTEEGFVPLADKQSRIILRIKELVEEQVSNPEQQNHNFSRVVTQALHMDYTAISTLFTATEGVTLERYLIERRTQKAKELMESTALSFADIAFRLGYASVQYFSSQFKRITGMTPTSYRQLLAKN
jgi:AraC-like DNA-binding protein